MHHELVERHGYAGLYKSVWRLTRRLGSREPAVAAGVIRTATDGEAQVDHGEGLMVRQPVSGRYQRPRMFVMTLSHSRKHVWLLGWNSGSQKWCELLQEAFRRLGGSARLIVQDNLKEGVNEPDAYHPVLNPLYRAFLQHHGVTGIAARVGDPDRKGKVERAVAHAQLALLGMKFEALEEAQAFLDG